MRFLIMLFASLAMTVAAGTASAADAKRGEKQFGRCKACHSTDAGKNKIGPSLHGIVGRKAGTAEKYKYSKSLAEAGSKGLVWTDETLMEYLENPTNFLKKYLKAKSVSNKMKNNFKNKALRENIIAYLKTVK